MRTSPLVMPLPRRACGLAAALALTLVLSAAACGDDGDDGASPTTAGTTAPTTTAASTDDPTAAPSDPAGSSTPGSSTPGDEGLSTAEVAAELDRLYTDYAAAFVAARERGGIDEEFRGDLARIFFPDLLTNELAGIESVGGTAALVPEPGPVVITEVTVEVSQPTCASGSAVFDLRPLVGGVVPRPMLRYFKIETSDAQAGWRFSALGSTESGDTFAGASCEEG